MSSTKTVVPGMDQQGFQPAGQPMPNFAQAPSPANQAGTVFPGMGVNPAPNKTVSMPSVDDKHKPIVGFLFSVSRTVVGEFWPIYLGQNTMGRGLGSGIVLAEQTVSDNHCKIIAQEQKNPDRLFVYVQECGSTCGTLVNGSSLDFNPREIKNGDIITVGEHYDLYVVLVDSKQLGLKKNEDFLQVHIQNPNPAPFQQGGFIPPMGSTLTTPAGGIQPGQQQGPKPYPGTVPDTGAAW